MSDSRLQTGDLRETVQVMTFDKDTGPLREKVDIEKADCD